MLVLGGQISQAISVAATLRLPDLVGDAPRSTDDLAADVGAHSRSLYRLLRALASVGIFREEEGRRFASTPMSDEMRSDRPLHGWTVYQGRPYFRASWAALEHSIRTGENAFHNVFGTDVWSWRAEHPQEQEIFDGAMRSLALVELGAVLDAFDFGRFGTIVDVGGGNGTLIAEVLKRWPDVRGIVFDRDHVVGAARAVLERDGVADRAEAVGGSFFDSVPRGGDAYVLKAIVHDWADDEATEILRAVRASARERAALLVVEKDLGPRNQRPIPKFSDLNMLVNPFGQERTQDEYAALFEAAGFRFVGATPSASGVSVFEGIAR